MSFTQTLLLTRVRSLLEVSSLLLRLNDVLSKLKEQGSTKFGIKNHLLLKLNLEETNKAGYCV